MKANEIVTRHGTLDDIALLCPTEVDLFLGQHDWTQECANGQVYVALCNNEPSALLVTDTDYRSIVTLWTSPCHRRRGCASALVAMFVRELAFNGISRSDYIYISEGSLAFWQSQTGAVIHESGVCLFFQTLC